MDKVFRAIGRFFKKIWDWIKTTAWIQPLLIVGIIFGIIFSINPIVNAIKSAVNEDDTGKFYEKHSVKFSDLFDDIPNQKEKYASKNLLGKNSGEVLVIYVTDNTMENDIASFYNSAKGKGVKLYIVNFTDEDNQKSEWDKEKKKYVDNDAAYYYDYLLEQLVETYNNPEGKWRKEYSEAFEKDYGYSVFYSGFSKDETYDDSSANGGASDAYKALHLPAVVKYNNGEVVDMRFATSGSFTDYGNNKSLTNYQVIADLWTGLKTN